MIATTLAQVAAAVDGTVDGDPALVVTGPAFVDSRESVAGGLFVAVPGERVDGHDYARDAVASGAVAVLVSRQVGVPAVVVDDPVRALGRLARSVLERLPALTVVAVTGSQGKTSTKDLLAQLLSAAGSTVATAGSFNNEIGLPLTVLRAEADTAFLVLEMGARGEGHLTYLCDIAPPDVALVLNVGKAHLGEFGSQDRIARAKGELVAVLGPDGVAVLNADDVLVLAMAERTPGRVVTFGESPAADVRLENVAVDSLGRPRFDLAFTAPGATGQAIQGVTQHVELPLVGEHQAGNAAAAAAVAAAVGISPPEIADALRRVRLQSRWRMELHELPTGVTVINDAYNASPDSMRAALKTLAAIGRGRSPRARTVAVLGEMRELGEAGREEHDAVGRLAVRLDISQLLVVGEPAHALHLGASLEGSWDEESVFVPDTDEALRWLRANLVPGDVVLVKASRAAGLERVAEALVTEAAQTPVEPPR